MLFIWCVTDAVDINITRYSLRSHFPCLVKCWGRKMKMKMGEKCPDKVWLTCVWCEACIDPQYLSIIQLCSILSYYMIIAEIWHIIDTLKMSYGEEVVLSEDVSLDLDNIDEYDNILISDPDPESVSQIWDGEKQNVLALSVLLCLTLVTNFSALPVILFRRTR